MLTDNVIIIVFQLKYLEEKSFMPGADEDDYAGTKISFLTSSIHLTLS